MENREYRRWKWFYSKLHLIDALAFSYHAVAYDLLPETEEAEEGFDEFFRAEAELQDKGWSSFSLNTYSPFELARLKRFARKYPADVFISPQTEFSICEEVVAIVGEAKTVCAGFSVSPERCNDFVQVLESMPERPCLAIFESCPKLPKGVKRLLRGKNHHVLSGRYGTAVSFEVIPGDDYDAIAEFAKLHSRRSLAPPLRQPMWSSATASATATVTIVSYSSL